MLLIMFVVIVAIRPLKICVVSLNTKQHSAKSPMAKAISGHGAPKSGVATAIAAVPVAPPVIGDSHTKTLSLENEPRIIV